MFMCALLGSQPEYMWVCDNAFCNLYIRASKACAQSLLVVPNRLFVKPCVSEWFVGPHITINISALPLLCTLKKKSLLVCAHEISSKHGNTAEVRTDVWTCSWCIGKTREPETERDSSRTVVSARQRNIPCLLLFPRHAYAFYPWKISRDVASPLQTVKSQSGWSVSTFQNYPRALFRIMTKSLECDPWFLKYPGLLLELCLIPPLRT